MRENSGWARLCNRINETIRKETTLRKGGRVDAKYWNGDSQRRKLYKEVQNTFKRGKSFGGHGNWYAFLENEPHINNLSSLTRKEYYPKQLHQIVANAITNKQPMRFEDWQADAQLSRIYSAIKARGFFGHRGWKEYLKNKHRYSHKRIVKQ